MVAVFWCDADIEDRLERRVVFGGPKEFTEAWRTGSWKGAEPHLALLVEDDGANVRWLGRALGGRRVTSRDRSVKVTEIEEIDPVPLEQLESALPARHRSATRAVGLLSQAAGRALTDAIKRSHPELSELIATLSRPLSWDPPLGARGELLNQERDGVGLLLEISGIERGTLRNWSTPQEDEPFLSGLPHAAALEDAIITHDVDRFGDWVRLPDTRVDWRVFQDGPRKVLVMNANRTPVEHTLGVDVLYFNEARGSFVLVQYKKMRKEGHPPRQRLVYRPDTNLHSELDRMRAVDDMSASAGGEFRLLNTPCWLKLCDPNPKVQDPATLVKGMYLARAHFEELLGTCKGPRGGPQLSFENVPRHLNNTTFIDLVQGGWVGSRGTATSTITDLLHESLRAGRSVVLGAALPAS